MKFPNLAIMACLAAPVFAVGAPAPPPARPVVVVAPAKISIIIGTVSLKLEPFVWNGSVYVSRYAATVFPYFLFNEHGMVMIDATDDQAGRLGRGEPISIVGRAVNSEGDKRRLECRITPADKSSGAIKVRVVIPPGFTLTFNTTYKIGNK
jgi:hypothetical protein